MIYCFVSCDLGHFSGVFRTLMSPGTWDKWLGHRSLTRKFTLETPPKKMTSPLGTHFTHTGSPSTGKVEKCAKKYESSTKRGKIGSNTPLDQQNLFHNQKARPKLFKNRWLWKSIWPPTTPNRAQFVEKSTKKCKNMTKKGKIRSNGPTDPPKWLHIQIARPKI